jgi:hypothetical protein
MLSFISPVACFEWKQSPLSYFFLLFFADFSDELALEFFRRRIDDKVFLRKGILHSRDHLDRLGKDRND